MANLTLDQLDRMGRLADTDTGQDWARALLIDGLAQGELLAGRPRSHCLNPLIRTWRHGRSCATQYRLVSHPTMVPGYLSGVLAVFDAGLAIAAAPIDPADTADYELLTSLPLGSRVGDPPWPGHDHWALAWDKVNDAALAWGYPLRPQCLFWEAVPAAEDAAGESPTDPYLADALWGAATTQAFAGRLSLETITTLAAPWHAAGLSLPT